MAPYWQHFNHLADNGVRGVDTTVEGAFEQAALALTAVMSSTDTVACDQPVEVECDAPDHELLLVDWLNALIYQMACRKMIFGCFEVTIKPLEQGLHLHATAWGEPISVARHQPAVEVKGATYTELQVAQQSDGSWLAQCVVDV